MDLERFIEWYKWVLSFHPVKYLGIGIMTLGPWFFLYRFIFLGTHRTELSLGILGSVFLGCIVWSLGWDPYGSNA